MFVCSLSAPLQANKDTHILNDGHTRMHAQTQGELRLKKIFQTTLCLTNNAYTHTHSNSSKVNTSSEEKKTVQVLMLLDFIPQPTPG